jgi:uroporphyrinogen-III synthase
MSFQGMRVLSLESRRAAEMAELIRRQGGEPFVAPSVRESPVAASIAPPVGFEMFILLTGVGTRQLHRLVPSLPDILRSATVVARGPKPAAALREMGLAPAIVAPEPNTWREVLRATEGRPEKRIAVQEYGRPATELIEGLRARAAEVTPIRVYEYALPEDLAPLEEAARRLAAGGFDAALFTTAVQIQHLMRVAEEAGLGRPVLDALGRLWVGSIGPTTTEALEEFGIAPRIEPSHPKMGLLVREAAERAGG